MQKNTIITFDLHGVIFTFDYKKVIRILWNYNHKWGVFTTIFHLPLVFTLLKMLWNDATDEEFYELFEKRRPILLPLIIEVTNAQKIITGMDTLLKDLHEHDNTMHILSNIGPRRFKQLSSDFPQIMRYFKKVKIVNPNNHPAIKKPAAAYFNEYLSQDVDPNQHVIFIDDNKKNIKVAQSLGITTIRFKSAQLLRQKLKTIEIM